MDTFDIYWLLKGEWRILAEQLTLDETITLRNKGKQHYPHKALLVYLHGSSPTGNCPHSKVAA